MSEWKERVATAIHAVHGTRGLAIGGLGLLILGILEPILPGRVNSLPVVLPVFVLFVIGAATLPREGVAGQQRARNLVRVEDGTRRLMSTLVWPILLCLALAPKFFLGGYGIPHLNPLTGLIFPAYQHATTHGFLFVVLLLAVMYLRSTRRYASHVLAKRPVQLSRHDRAHQERDGLLWMGAGLLIVFGWLLRGFWRPFSLLEWPPGLDSLVIGARGVAAISFSLVLPLLLFMVATAHLALLRAMWKEGVQEQRNAVMVASLHVALAWGAIALHAYDLLWIAQYRAGSPF